jgi:uncharacterized membrane protein
MNKRYVRYVIVAIDTITIFIALATIIHEHGKYMISLAMFPILAILSGANYARKHRTIFIVLQALFFYLVIAESLYWIVFRGHGAVIIGATIIPLVVISFYTFLSERNKLKVLIANFFNHFLW